MNMRFLDIASQEVDVADAVSTTAIRKSAG